LWLQGEPQQSKRGDAGVLLFLLHVPSREGEMRMPVA